jgi:hypothetical protein
VRSVNPVTKPHHLVYDDGDEERIDLNFHDFFILESGVDESRFGSTEGTRVKASSETSFFESECIRRHSPVRRPRTITEKSDSAGSKHINDVDANGDSNPRPTRLARVSRQRRRPA